MKNLLKKLTFSIICLLSTANSVFAKNVNVNDLIPRPGTGEEFGLNPKTSQDLGAVANLPQVTSEQVMSSAIKTLLGWTTLFTIVALVFAGIYYIIARGKEENLTKAKNIIMYLIIGVAIMASAYAIVTGLLKFDFFN